MSNQHFHRALFVAAFVALLLPHSARADEALGNIVAEDRCVVEFNVPTGTRITFDGRDYGLTRRIEVRNLSAKQFKPVSLVLDRRTGQRVRKQLLLRGGWHIPFTLSEAEAPTLVLQTGHLRAVQCADISKDDRLVATGSADGTAIVWDAATGRKLRTIRATKGNIKSVAFSPGRRQILAGEGDFGRTDCSAVLWDIVSGTKIRTFSGHEDSIHVVCFSPDGKYVLTGSADKTAVLWNVQTGTKVRTFEGHKDTVSSAAFAPDGHHILTGSWDRTAVLWDSRSGNTVQTFGRHTADVRAVAFSPDGRQVATGAGGSLIGPDRTELAIWNASTGQRIQTLKGHRRIVSSVEYSQDGRFLLSASRDKTAIVWNTDDWTKQRTLHGHTSGLTTAKFSHDASRVLTGSDDHTAVLWDRQTGSRRQTFAGKRDKATSASFSSDNRYILSNAMEYHGRQGHGLGIVWDTGSGNRLNSLNGTRGTFSPDNNHVLTLLESNNTAAFWNIRSGKQVHSFAAHKGTITSFDFSRNGTRLLTGSTDNSAIIWETATGKDLFRLEGHKGDLSAVTFSSTGRLAATGSEDDTARIWDATNGRELHHLQGHNLNVTSLAFSPDESKLLTGESDAFHVHQRASAILWDTESGRLLNRLDHHSMLVASTDFSADGRYLLTRDYFSGFLADARTGALIQPYRLDKGRVHSLVWTADNRHLLTRQSLSGQKARITLRRASDAKEIHSFDKSEDGLTSICLSRDSRMVLTTSEYGNPQIWDMATGQVCCSLISLDSGRDWLVMTPEGLFDGSDGGMNKVMFRIGRSLNTVPVSRFFQDFYYPGLLAAIWRGERPMPVVRIGHQLPPSVVITKPGSTAVTSARSAQISVRITNQGGGMAPVVLRQNGARVAEAFPAAGARVFEHTFDVQLVEGVNRLRVESASADGSFESEPAEIILHCDRSQPKADLYVVAVGVNNYAEDSLKLTFAARDAAAMADLFRRRGRALYDQIHVTELLDAASTKRGIRDALRKVSEQAREQDTLIVFLSGHGVAIGQRFYFVPQDLKLTSNRFEDDVEDSGYAGDQLGRHMGEVKALKQILILDTCNSGAAIGKSRLKRRNPFAFARAIRTLSRTQGIHTIAAAAASEDTIEINELKHGVLTYSLLSGLQALDSSDSSADGNKDGIVTVLEWFSHAAEEVPKLTEKFLGTAQDIQIDNHHESFPVLPVKGDTEN